MAPDRIDVHHHFNPQFFVDVLNAHGGHPSGLKSPFWSEESNGAVMRKHDIATSILSITAPGAAILEGAEAARLARKMNEYAAKMRDENPSSYGFFVNLPSILDREATLNELNYSLDVLRADGVCLFTRYGTGQQYIGHPDFQYLWAELNRRSAVVFIHPTHPVDTALVDPLLPQPVLNYAFETTKAAVDLIISKTIRNFRNLKIILSHAGGTLPYLVERPTSIIPHLGSKVEYKTEDMMEDARDFYYDTALSGGKNALMVLEKFAKPGHILYGSDFPYAPSKVIDYHTHALDAFPFEMDGFLQDINVTNANALFPRLAEYQK
ncbi:hypothetical protein MMC17_001712 [Xylographa soralifera]|nr:hypothetical protein [Xylographa soralifera]